MQIKAGPVDLAVETDERDVALWIDAQCEPVTFVKLTPAQAQELADALSDAARRAAVSAV